MSYCIHIALFRILLKCKGLQSWKLRHEAKDGQSDEHSEILAEGLAVATSVSYYQHKVLSVSTG